MNTCTNEEKRHASFATRLVEWQLANGRHELPWQRTRDAYRIWLSEIMLQQTQVAAVVGYYARFLERFPDLPTLARAPLQAVLEQWAGLGYYARAHNLHRCAQALVDDHDGAFPENAEDLAELPGIGRSTAAAISVFAFARRAAILDGNVKRVLARCFGIEGFPGEAATQRVLWTLADALLPTSDVEAYTQGLMDLGSGICTRGKPACGACPMHDLCIARRDSRQTELPKPRPKKLRPQRQSSVLILTDGQRVLVEQRPPTGIWGGLLSLPEVAVADAERFALGHACRLLSTELWLPLHHGFTHFELELQPLKCEVVVSANVAGKPGWHWLEYRAIERAALPAPIRTLLRRLLIGA